jgi:hypothetical protein
VFGFLVATIFYKARLSSREAKRKATKGAKDAAAKAVTESRKKRKQHFNTLSRWSLSVAFLVVLILGIYLYTKPF